MPGVQQRPATLGPVTAQLGYLTNAANPGNPLDDRPGGDIAALGDGPQPADPNASQFGSFQMTHERNQAAFALGQQLDEDWHGRGRLPGGTRDVPSPSLGEQCLNPALTGPFDCLKNALSGHV